MKGIGPSALKEIEAYRATLGKEAVDKTATTEPGTPPGAEGKKDDKVDEPSRAEPEEEQEVKDGSHAEEETDEKK